MGKHLIRFLIAAVVFGGLAAPVVVQAQSVIVLGLRSAEGDDEFANNVSGALRNAASRVSGWELNTREVSLAQMTLAHGCDAADVSCMEAIGNTLGVRFVLYGSVRRTSTQANHDYALNLFMFDTESGSISNQLTDTIPRVQADIDDLRPRVRRYIAQFSGAEQTGTISVRVNLPAAEVLIDGETMGSTTGGAFETTVPVGQHQIEVRADGHNTFRGSVTVGQDATASVEVELVEGDEDEIIVAPDPGGGTTPDEGGGGPNWGAIASFGVAGVGAVMTVVSWVMVDSANSDLQLYREIVGVELANTMPPTPPAEILDTNACEHMRANPGNDGRYPDGVSTCDQGDLWTALQYVFLGVTGAAAVAGILFIVLDSDDEEAPSTVQLRPSFGPERASLSASMTF